MASVRVASVVDVNPSGDLKEDLKLVQALLPENYGATVVRKPTETLILIVGYDVAGWTLEDYVIPRLASGMIYTEEVHLYG